MALPSLTAPERADALAKAAAARVRRAQVKADLKSGKLKLSEVLDSAEEDEAITRMKVVALLQALPRVGATTAQSLLDEFEISQSRRVKGLGAKQRAKLIDRFG